ncbi:MAG: hypothetical protein ABW106_16210 [Steroidobacteraceae bacterium]
MAWFVIRDALGEVIELTNCSNDSAAQLERMTKAIKSWQQRGDHAVQLDNLKYRMTSFDGNVRVLSIEPDAAHAMD